MRRRRIMSITRKTREVCSPRSTMTRRMVRDMAARITMMVRRRIRRRKRIKRRRRRNMVEMIMMVVAAAAVATATRSHPISPLGLEVEEEVENKQEKQIDLINGDSSRSLLL